jgi:hypothetical protein
MPRKELYLFQFTAIYVAKLCARSAEIVRRQSFEL